MIAARKVHPILEALFTQKALLNLREQRKAWKQMVTMEIPSKVIFVDDKGTKEVENISWKGLLGKQIAVDSEKCVVLVYGDLSGWVNHAAIEIGRPFHLLRAPPRLSC